MYRARIQVCFRAGFSLSRFFFVVLFFYRPHAFFVFATGCPCLVSLHFLSPLPGGVFRRILPNIVGVAIHDAVIVFHVFTNLLVNLNTKTWLLRVPLPTCRHKRKHAVGAPTYGLYGRARKTKNQNQAMLAIWLVPMVSCTAA